MSNRNLKNYTKPELKSKLAQMGMSLDRSDHPRNYYMQMYLEKSNAKNKVTRDNTPFYSEQIINRKREREQTSDKKRVLRSKKKIEEDLSYEEEELEENIKSNKKKKNYGAKSQKKNLRNEQDDKDVNESGIKVTRLILTKKNAKPQVQEENNNKRYLRSNKVDINEYKNYDIINLKSNRKTVLNNSNAKKQKEKEKDDFIYYDKYIGTRTRNQNSSNKNKKKEEEITKNIFGSDKKEKFSKKNNPNNSQSKEKNNIKFGAQKNIIEA